MQEKLAIIGGSGVYEIFEDSEKLSVETPYGKVENVSKITLKEKEVYFLPRHGPEHSVPPHLINYRANIFSLHKLGVKNILATNAVGSIEVNIKPGNFVIPDQIIDMTKNRILTFYDGSTKIDFDDGTTHEGVVHLDYSDPYCPRLRKLYVSLLQDVNERVFDEGVNICSEGPRFETPAEIQMFQKIGGTLVGMTTVPEAILAKEVKICYATLCLVTNYGAGMQEKVTHEEVIELFKEKTNVIKQVMKNAIAKKMKINDCKCHK
ncbi:MAG: S-methyl-5'-thioadenosine phosphorylase [Candidatus Heimdallarchaeota archaeon]|nr:S-methyl-5'-thioadenosine phosphorylase [Candidatus Heimdallarchaeota archaeon]MCK4954606.1 S-methyl-5'-thioadenosine phosphorylase [Candidatus Heimdallarchaeota archaeon]